MIRPALLGLISALALAGAAWSDSAHVIAQQDRAFHPGEITIKAGESLVFTNQDSFIHQIYSSGLFDSDERAPGQTIRETFPATGTFEVRCHIHPKMRLVVHVR